MNLCIELGYSQKTLTSYNDRKTFTQEKPIKCIWNWKQETIRLRNIIWNFSHSLVLLKILVQVVWKLDFPTNMMNLLKVRADSKQLTRMPLCNCNTSGSNNVSINHSLEYCINWAIFSNFVSFYFLIVLEALKYVCYNNFI